MPKANGRPLHYILYLWLIAMMIANIWIQIWQKKKKSPMYRNNYKQQEKMINRADMAYQTEVVIGTQPQPMGTNYTFTSQGAWSSELCDCCSDMGICLCASFVPCILACRISEQAGECCCLPYLPGSLIALRTGVRERYHIEGSICDDWIVMSCCPLCGMCQLARELNSNN